MFSHIMVGANDLKAMVAFYDAVLSRVGLHRTVDVDDVDAAGVIWQRKGLRWPQFAIRNPINGQPATAGNGIQISFMCGSRATVKGAWESALRHGGMDEGEPGYRAIYAEDFYAAYARDPEGNKLCFLYCPQFSD